MQLSVATICRESSTPSRNEAIMASFRELAEQGRPTVAGDGGSSPEFVAAIRDLGHEVIQPGRGLRGQMEVALEGAAERGTHVLYVESDKSEFLGTQLPTTLARFRRRKLDFAVLGRGRQAFMTFPYEQRAIETAESTLIGDVLGIRGDFVAGPVIMPAGHVAVLKESPRYGGEQYGWGVPWYLMGRAHRDGLKVGTINTGVGVRDIDAHEFNPGYRLMQATAILGCFYEGAGHKYDWQT